MFRSSTGRHSGVYSFLRDLLWLISMPAKGMHRGKFTTDTLADAGLLPSLPVEFHRASLASLPPSLSAVFAHGWHDNDDRYYGTPSSLDSGFGGWLLPESLSSGLAGVTT